MQKLLIANRGEIAVRIARTAAEMGCATVAVFSEDDAASLHTRKTDEAVGLKGSGPAAYLDIAQVVAAAKAAACDAVHPGYGFLSENAAFARACAEAGLTFVGPTPETLELFGDKGRARALAQQCGARMRRCGCRASGLRPIWTLRRWCGRRWRPAATRCIRAMASSARTPISPAPAPTRG